MNFQILNYLMNENLTVIEAKLIDLPESAPKSERYKWLQINDSKVTPLAFISMREEEINGKQMNIRIFENAELRFDKSFARFISGENMNILMNQTGKSLAADIDKLIRDHLSS